MEGALIVLAWFAGFVVIYLVGQRRAVRRRSRERIFEEAEPGGPPLPAEESGLLARWLSRAGYRGENTVVTFVSASILGLCLGLVLTYVLVAARLVPRAVHDLERLPGGMGDIALPAVYVGPWLPIPLLASLPLLIVRARRRRRVAAIEEDLPLFLELLATLGEAGIGLDAALERVLTAQEAGRPLTAEFRTFQLEILAGRGRVPSLRRLTRRVDVMAFSVFVSALVQAEQSGSGVADVLRRQAEDQRSRRREQATAFAMALPVKLLFPLVICFLPGLFVVTLGPIFYQFFQAADSVIRTKGPFP